MDIGALMDAAEAAIRTQYPDDPIYRDELPKDFQRPSFTLECQKDDLADAAIGLVRRTVTLLVTCYVAVDAYHDSSRDELNRRQETVMSLLAGKPLRVEDRSLTAKTGKGTGAPDYGEVTAVYSFLDSRPGYVDEDTEEESVSGVPLMEEFTMDVSTKKE
jgi:hypothetical protein